MALGGVVREDAGEDPVDRALLGLADLSFFWESAGAENAGEVGGIGVRKRLPDSLRVPSSLELEYRLAEINRTSPMEFRYHERVERYVKLYLQERRDQVERMLGLSDLYFPLFRETLDRYRLPLELVYVAVVESALNPLAVSRSGAVGLWQFKLNTAEMFGLYVDSFVDARVDPGLSTEAACLYLQYLYKLFEDWNLALSAYNAGPGTVQRAIQRAGGERDFWKLHDYLPEAAVNYVAAFIAVAYVFKHHEEHGLEAIPPKIDFRSVDTVYLEKALSFSVLSEWAGVPVELLHFLNPQYRQGYVPHPVGGKPARFVLPKDVIPKYIEHRQRIYAQSHKTSETPFPQAEAEKIKVTHRVRRGEYLHRIAMLYECSADDIRGWNGLKGNEIHPDQELTVWVTPAQYAEVQRSGAVEP